MVTSNIDANSKMLNTLKPLSIELTIKALGITVRTTYIVVAMPNVEPLLIPGM